MASEAIIILVLVIIAVLFLIREIICWYFKLNKISNSLDMILQELSEVNRKLTPNINDNSMENLERESTSENRSENNEETTENPFLNKGQYI